MLEEIINELRREDTLLSGGTIWCWTKSTLERMRRYEKHGFVCIGKEDVIDGYILTDAGRKAVGMEAV